MHLDCPFCCMNMLSEAVVQQWTGTDYETKVLYTCKRCGVPFEKINDKLYTQTIANG